MESCFHIFLSFFTGIFGVRKVQCYLSVQVTVLLEIIIIIKLNEVPVYDGSSYFFVMNYHNKSH